MISLHLWGDSLASFSQWCLPSSTWFTGRLIWYAKEARKKISNGNIDCSTNRPPTFKSIQKFEFAGANCADHRWDTRSHTHTPSQTLGVRVWQKAKFHTNLDMDSWTYTLTITYWLLLTRSLFYRPTFISFFFLLTP